MQKNVVRNRKLVKKTTDLQLMLMLCRGGLARGGSGLGTPSHAETAVGVKGKSGAKWRNQSEQLRIAMAASKGGPEVITTPTTGCCLAFSDIDHSAAGSVITPFCKTQAQRLSLIPTPSTTSSVLLLGRCLIASFKLRSRTSIRVVIMQLCESMQSPPGLSQPY